MDSSTDDDDDDSAKDQGKYAGKGHGKAKGKGGKGKAPRRPRLDRVKPDHEYLVAGKGSLESGAVGAIEGLVGVPVMEMATMIRQQPKCFQKK